MAHKNVAISNLTNMPTQASYVFTVQLVDSNNNPVTSNGIQNNQQFTVVNIGSPFTLKFILPDTTYSLANCKFVVYFNNKVIGTTPLFTLNSNCSTENIQSGTPPEVSYIGITRDNPSRNTSLYLTSSKPLRWRISAADGGEPPQGLTVGNQPWNSTSWNPMETEWAVNPITHIARVNPISNGVGGVIGGATYYIDLATLDTPNSVFRLTYTIPNETISSMREVTSTTGCSKVGGTVVDWRGPFASHIIAEGQACLDSGTGGQGVLAAGLTLTSDAYINTVNNNCEKLDNGYYYVKISGNIQLKTLRITSGEISELEDFTCSAPSPTNSTVGTGTKIVGDFQYNWINSLNTNVEVDNDGKVKLTAPVTKPSFNGSKTCYRHVIGDMHQEIVQSDRDALFGPTGMEITEGSFGFFLIYAATSGGPNYDVAMNSGSWTMYSDYNILGNGQSARNNNSAQLETIIISKVRITSDLPVNELKEPKDLRYTSFLPVYQSLGNVVTGLPSHQMWGTTKLFTTGKTSADVISAFNRIKDLGIRIQYVSGDAYIIGVSSLWRNIQALVPHYTTDANAIANAFYQGRSLVTVSEVAENVGNRTGCPPCWQVAQDVHRNLYNKAVSDGATSPLDYGGYGDYFQHLHGEDNGVQYRTIANGRMLMASQANARLQAYPPFETDQYQTCGYFGNGAYNYRSWLEVNYLDCPIHGNQGSFIYRLIRQIERKFMAAPNRKVAIFTTQSYEGVNMDTIRTGVDFRLRFSAESGELVRRTVNNVCYSTLKSTNLWALLAGAGVIFWDTWDIHNDDPYTFQFGHWSTDEHGEPIPSMTRWLPNAGGNVQWNNSNPAHPTRVASDAGRFPARPMDGENGGFAALWLYRECKVAQNRMSNTLEWANYTYTVNGGGTLNGYIDSSAPRTGSNGAKVNTFGLSNPGQDNAVTVEWNKLPICWYFDGAGGKGIVFQNPLAKLNDVHVINVNNGGGLTATVVGKDAHIFLFP